MKKIIFISTIFFVAQSCSSNVKGGWSCPTPEGGKGSCISIKNADFSEKTDSTSNEKSRFTYLDSAQKIEIKLIAPKLADLKKIAIKPTAQDLESCKVDDHNVSLESQNKLRTKERVGKIWFSPHIDAEGNQHSESVIFVVDEEPKWVIQR